MQLDFCQGMWTIAHVCQLVTNDCCQFITLNIHFCAQHHGHDASHRASLWATADLLPLLLFNTSLFLSALNAYIFCSNFFLSYNSEALGVLSCTLFLLNFIFIQWQTKLVTCQLNTLIPGCIVVRHFHLAGVKQWYFFLNYLLLYLSTTTTVSPLGSHIRVPASAGVRAGMSPLPGGR